MNKRQILLTRSARRLSILFLVSVLSAIFRLFALPDMPMRWHLGTFFIFTASLFFVWEAFRLINYYLDKHLPYNSGIRKRIVVQLVIGAISMSIFRRVWVELVSNYTPPEILKLALENPILLYAAFMLDILISFLFNANFIGVHFFEEWKKGLIRNERLQKERAQVQFDNLKNQVNPHLLFNSLTSLNALIFDNPQLASKFLQHLTKVYRYVLQHKEKGDVSLETELDFINQYIFLIQTKYGKGLNIRVDIPESHFEKRIVPVTLQILMQNALKHNIASEARPLNISLYIEGDHLCVENNLQLKGLVESSNKTGLGNLKTLYAFMREKPLLIEEGENRFKVCVPLV